MKKIVSVVLSLLAMTALASCGGDAAASAAGKYTLDKEAFAADMKAAQAKEPAEGAAAEAAAAMIKTMVDGMNGTFDLKADGTCSMSMTMMGQKQDKDGTWKLEGDKLSVTVKEGDKDDTRVLDFADGVITMEEGEGEKKMSMKFKKAE